MNTINNLLQLNKCSVLYKYVKVIKEGNSEVISLPPLTISEIFNNDQVEISANYVKIKGNDYESPHYHVSHVVAVIMTGKAQLFTEKEIIPVSSGDGIIIPKGVEHKFVCENDENMSYMSYEVSNQPLDFIKHFNN